MANDSVPPCLFQLLVAAASQQRSWTAAPAVAGPAEDPSAPPSVTGLASTATTVSFTPAANSLLVAVSNCGNTSGAGTVTAAVTDSLGSTWTMLKRANGSGPGSSEVWAMDAGSSPAARTVTVTGAGGVNATGVSLNVEVLVGAQPVATCLGASASFAGTTANSIALTTTTAGSLAVGGYVNIITGTGALVPNASTTAWQSFLDTTNTEKYGAWRATALTGTPGPGTYGYTNAPANNQSMAAVEILAATAGSTVTGDAAPAGAGDLTATVTQAADSNTAGAGTLTASATQAAGATLAGAGALSAAAAVIVPGTATLAGAGSLSANGSGAVQGTATLVGAGTLAASVRQAATASPAGAGAVTAAVTQRATASPAGAGVLAASVVQQATATLTGAGSLVGNAGGTVTGTATLTGGGALSATVAQRATANPAGAGTVTAAGIIRGTAALVGAGALTASVRQQAAASLAGAGSLTASAGGTVNGTASLVGAGALTADGGGSTTPRPFSGVTARPDTGQTIRPGSATTARPDSGTTIRPFTTTTPRP